MAIRKIPTDTATYHFYNANPKNKRSCDCVIRALATAMNKSWDDVLDGLVEICHKTKCVPDEAGCYEEYLKHNGWAKMPMPKKIDGKRYTAGEWASKNKDKVMVITISGHMTISIAGVVNDIWDCTRGCVCNYWVKML